MRALALFALLVLPLLSFAQDRHAALAQLKAAFPQHTDGPVTEKSDPLVIECYEKYRKPIVGLTLERLPADLGALRKQLERDIDRYDRELESAKDSGKYSTRQKVLTPSMRRAISANAAWLKSKVRPYLARLESFQRGR